MQKSNMYKCLEETTRDISEEMKVEDGEFRSNVQAIQEEEKQQTIDEIQGEKNEIERRARDQSPDDPNVHVICSVEQKRFTTMFRNSALWEAQAQGKELAK